MLVKEEDKRLVRVTRVVVKVGTGTQAPRRGLVFLFDHEDAASETFLEQFSQYDDWGLEEYQRMRQERYSPPNRDQPLLQFTSMNLYCKSSASCYISKILNIANCCSGLVPLMLPVVLPLQYKGG